MLTSQRHPASFFSTARPTAHDVWCQLENRHPLDTPGLPDPGSRVPLSALARGRTLDRSRALDASLDLALERRSVLERVPSGKNRDRIVVVIPRVGSRLLFRASRLLQRLARALEGWARSGIRRSRFPAS